MTSKELINLIQDPQTVDKVFKEKKGAYLPPVQTPKGVFLIEIKDKKEKRNLEFSEVKEKVKEDYLKEKGKALCEDKAKSLIALVKKGEDFVKTAQAKGFKILGSTVKRKDFDPQIGLSKDLKLGIIEEPRVLEDRTQVLYLERVENPANLKPEEISLAKEAFISLKKEVIQRALFKDLQDKKNIKIYPLFKQL